MDQISNQISDQVNSQVTSQIDQYLQTATGNIGSNVSDFMFQWLIIPSLVFMGLVLIIMIYRTVRRHHVEKAIFEIRDALVHKEPKKSVEPEVAE